jgi:DNA-binding MarR family transcriptional regulator
VSHQFRRDFFPLASMRRIASSMRATTSSYPFDASHCRHVLRVEQGSLYPALHRLIKRGWITFDEGMSENNRKAKFYRLTSKGRKQLAVETSKWDKLAWAIARVLRPT